MNGGAKYGAAAEQRILNPKALRVTSTLCWQTLSGGGQIRNSHKTKAPQAGSLCFMGIYGRSEKLEFREVETRQ